MKKTHTLYVPRADGASLPKNNCLLLMSSSDNTLGNFPANIVKKQKIYEKIMTTAFIFIENRKFEILRMPMAVKSLRIHLKEHQFYIKILYCRIQ